MTTKQKILKQYFTNAHDIKNMMCELLGSVDGLSLLEPSVGHGAFFSGLIGTPKCIDAVDVDGDALKTVYEKFKHLNIDLHHCDFIRIFDNDLLSDSHKVAETTYDAVISNPPYGLYFELEYRRQLKKTYPDFYVRESYGLFFMLSLLRLKENGRYVFLLPDTFLSSVTHTPLRKFIMGHAAPTHIIRFPSSKFETVNFAYGNLCIIAGNKRESSSTDELFWSNIFDKNIALGKEEIENIVVSGLQLSQNISSGWSEASFSTQSDEISDWITLGELAECRTGIYTGDNEKFIGYDPEKVTRRINGHPIRWDCVNEEDLTEKEKEKGISSGKYYVPMIRGGHRQPFDQPSSAINWSEEAVEFYKNNKKSRLQNSKFYFKSGLSMPMVTTRRISAALMNNAVFDQGVVGIFPHQGEDIPSLLIYLNSTEASRRMKEITNGSANNSANYIKRLPVPKFTNEQYKRAEEIYLEATKNKYLPLDICDEFVQSVIGATIPDMSEDQLVGLPNDVGILEINLRSN